jgi:hypothetical protein
VANVGDNELAPRLVEQLPAEVRYALGDTHYNDPEVRESCQARGIELVATRRGPHPHRDGGVEVRRIFHKKLSQNSRCQQNVVVIKIDFPPDPQFAGICPTCWDAHAD